MYYHGYFALASGGDEVLTRHVCVCKYCNSEHSAAGTRSTYAAFPIVHSNYTLPVTFMNHILQSIFLLCCHLKPLDNGRRQFSGAGHCLSILLRQYQRQCEEVAVAFAVCNTQAAAAVTLGVLMDTLWKYLLVDGGIPAPVGGL